VFSKILENQQPWPGDPRLLIGLRSVENAGRAASVVRATPSSLLLGGAKAGSFEPSNMEIAVQHHTGLHRFEIHVEGATACLEYLVRGKTLVLAQTYVPPPLRGKGLAGILTRHALDFARKEGKTVDPQCSYVAAWLDRHTEYANLREPKA